MCGPVMGVAEGGRTLLWTRIVLQSTVAAGVSGKEAAGVV